MSERILIVLSDWGCWGEELRGRRRRGYHAEER